MTSTSESTQRSRPVSTAAVVTHGRRDVHEAVDRVRAVASAAGVAIVEDLRAAEVVVARIRSVQKLKCGCKRTTQHRDDSRFAG